MVRYIFFGIKVISRLIGLTYENIAKMANKIFNVPNHLKQTSIKLILCYFIFSLNFQFNPSSSLYHFSAVDLKPDGESEVCITKPMLFRPQKVYMFLRHFF